MSSRVESRNASIFQLRRQNPFSVLMLSTDNRINKIESASGSKHFKHLWLEPDLESMNPHVIQLLSIFQSFHCGIRVHPLEELSRYLLTSQIVQIRALHHFQYNHPLLLRKLFVK